MAEQTCPVCGTAVRVVSSGEGTSHFEPVDTTARAEVARLTAALQEIAQGGKIAHPDQSDVWIIVHSAAGHQRCCEIARTALKAVPVDAT